LYLHLLADSDIHLPVFGSADLHRRQLSKHRDYGEITGGQNALSPGSVNYPLLLLVGRRLEMGRSGRDAFRSGGPPGLARASE